MMFHVERTAGRLKVIGKMLVLLVLVMCGCGISKPKHTIPNYVTIPNAIDVLGNNGLTAFVFENNKKNLPFQKFITWKFPTDHYLQREFWITIEEQRFKLIVYDKDDMDKYLNLADFVRINQDPEISELGDQPDFIAVSVIDSKNQDCLSDQSLQQQTVLKYLENLKDEYLNHE